MTVPPTPDWRLLSAEVDVLASTVEAIAARAGCSPLLVTDAVAETLEAGSHGRGAPRLEPIEVAR